MLKKLDRYIIQKFLVTTFFILGVIMSLAVVFDVSERVDDFVSKDAPLKAIVLEYYVNFIFFYSNMFSGLIIFIAVIFFTSKMAYDSEIIAILTGSVSFLHFLRPYFIGAAILVALSLYMNHWLIPDANKERLAFEEKYIGYSSKHAERNTHVKLSDSSSMYFENFSANNNMGFRFSLEGYQNDRLVYKLDAASFVWDTLKNQWTLRNYLERWIKDSSEVLHAGFQKDTTLGISPLQFTRKINVVSAMKTPELNAFIQEEKKRGSNNVVFYELEKHQRTSYPFSAFVLTFIGAVIANKKVRGGIGLHLATGVGICLIYILCIKTTTVLSTNAGMSPFWAVWTPNILFGFLGLYLYYRAQK